MIKFIKEYAKDWVAGNLCKDPREKKPWMIEAPRLTPKQRTETEFKEFNETIVMLVDLYMEDPHRFIRIHSASKIQKVNSARLSDRERG
jgi:hypothetical protein